VSRESKLCLSGLAGTPALTATELRIGLHVEERLAFPAFTNDARQSLGRSGVPGTVRPDIKGRQMVCGAPFLGDIPQ
jgi:hypothetical protein